MTETVTKRFYIGGLASDISAEEITERFSRFGKVRNLSLKSRTDDEGNHIKSFAHLDMESDEVKFKKCFDTYQNTKWKGSVLKLQYAKESFLERLAKEREENDINTPPENPSPAKAPDKSDIKGPAVPGTPVPGKPDWVVAKYGRVLPVLKLKKSYKIKGVKHDPSKHCHAAKVFKDESDPVTDPSCNKLTWELNTPDSEITKKRKGEFPADESPVKRNKSSVPISKTSQTDSSSFNITQNPFNSIAGERKNLYKKEEDELEIVKIGQDHKSSSKPLNNSNKFDSDIESDVEAKIIETGPKKNNKAVKKNYNNQVLKKNVVIPIKDGGEKQVPITVLNTGTVERAVDCKNSSVKKAETNNNVLSPKTFLNDKVPDFNCQSPQNETKTPELKGFKILNPNTAAVKSPLLKEIPHKISANLSSPKLPVGNNKNKFSGDDAPRLIPEFRGLSMLPDFPSPQIAELKKSQVVTFSVLSDAVENNISESKASHILTNNNSPKSKEKYNTNTEGEEGYDSASSADTDEIIARYKRTSQINSNVKPSSVEQSDVPTKPVNSSLLSKSPITPKGIKNSFIGEDSYYLSEYSPGALSDYSLPNSTPGVKTDESSYDSDLDSNDFELVVKKLSQKAKTVAPETRSKPVKAEIGRVDEKVIERHESKSPHTNLSGPKQNNIALLDNKEKTQSSAKNVEKSKLQENSSDKVKHAADNEKRLLAIREKLKLKDQQKSLMQKALQKVDSKENSGNRIVFSSDSESGASSDSDKDGIEDLNIKSKTKKKQKLTLFENSSEDDSDSEAMFESKPHFEGEKGEKLMKLERKIGDSRFKLDAKFADSSDEESVEEKGEIDEANAIDQGLQKEKAASLKVLENVIGKSTLDRFSEKIKRNTKHLIDMNAVRFDPTKILPQKEAPISDDKKKKQEMVSPRISLQINDVSSNKKEEKVKKRHEEVKTSEQKEVNGLIIKEQPVDLKSRKMKEKEQQQVIEKSDDSKIVESPVKSRAKLATSLVNLFKSKNGAAQEMDNTKAFSLLEQFDKDDNMEFRKEENDRSSEVKDDDKAPLSGLFKNSKQNDTNLEISKEKAVLLQKQLLEDSNDDLSEQDQGEDSENDTSTIQIPSLENKTEKQLMEAGRTDIRFSKEQWLQRWEELRPTIVKMYKRKHKEALKSKRVDNEMKRKKEFLKNAKKGHWSRKR